MTQQFDEWTIDLEGCRLAEIAFDGAVTLRMSDDDEEIVLRIEQPFVLASSLERHSLSPEGNSIELGNLLTLLHEGVVAATASKAGRLTLQFEGDASLEVDASHDFEAWELSGRHGLRVVSMPGGELN
jgi:hypothetical protein